ncbi:inactive pancreatic lipase-related protein 1-like [Acropora millepora]|uniref:inactive pancreatic lipase-related protein 1-like n=1 Tax=Acropora millepora TaxID=45264 RepID=UPI001CF401C3|nr:inactive pancreatic lipase-related protein 1-like [Acropora millepora]XP_029182871.2 inactive pancreatic lipase-related protein 1-like [Acropora millepora]XP_029182872.2 inactive pancreatic lipase-related protein 1-like [Acropora millepora]
MEKMLLMLVIFISFFAMGDFLSIGLPQVCYGRYGCFDHYPPFANLLVNLPQSPEIVGAKFYLFTRENKDASSAQELDDSDLNKLTSSNFNISRRTIIVCHGWTENMEGYVKWMVRLKDALLVKGDFNVILTDWSVGANQLYDQSTGNTRLVGAIAGELIQFLIYHNGNTNDLADNFYFIGFSLGAQIAGYTGSYLQAKYDKKLGRITGLDPASPFFTGRDNAVKLDQGDAKYVDVIHTNMPLVGTPDRSGHTDFYPDGGSVHPGCANEPNDVIFTIGCNHLRATEYYIKTVSEDCTKPWEGHPCGSYISYSLGFCNECGDGGCPLMGYRAEETKLEGEFYLNTDTWNTLCPAA